MFRSSIHPGSGRYVPFKLPNLARLSKEAILTALFLDPNPRSCRHHPCASAVEAVPYPLRERQVTIT